MVLKELNQRPDLGVDVVGLVDDDPEENADKTESAISPYQRTTERPACRAGAGNPCN